MDISEEERGQLVKILEREIYRLRSLEEDYRQARKPANVVIKAMADEGNSTIKIRVAELERMVAKFKGVSPEKPKDVPIHRARPA